MGSKLWTVLLRRADAQRARLANEISVWEQKVATSVEQCARVQTLLLEAQTDLEALEQQSSMAGDLLLRRNFLKQLKGLEQLAHHEQIKAETGLAEARRQWMEAMREHAKYEALQQRAEAQELEQERSLAQRRNDALAIESFNRKDSRQVSAAAEPALRR